MVELNSTMTTIRNSKLLTDGVNVTGGLTVTGEVTGGRIKVVGIVTGLVQIMGQVHLLMELNHLY